MGMMEDLQKLLQDLVTPNLKAIESRLHEIDQASKMRDEALAASIASKVELILARMDAQMARTDAQMARMDAQHSSVMNALSIDRRLEDLERRAKTSEPAAA